MPAESAAAIASNVFDESGCNTNSCCIDTNGLVSYGICQWNGERYDNLYMWCSAEGYDYTSLDGQLAYLDYELENGYSCVFSRLMAGGDVWDMAYIWAGQFEICSDEYWNTRGDNALALYNNIRQ
ncbi:MAG: phage tail tip lysozyme [Lachnospiraceae bacterium]|nr:phage tail tip lysozyme [Lachnospiraceae bacterium]